MVIKFVSMKSVFKKGMFVVCFAIVACGNIRSQVVYFCNQPDVNGLPVENASSFNFETNSGFLKVLLNNQKPFALTQLKLVVKELIQDSFIIVKQNVIQVNSNSNFTSLDYKIDHDGDYRFIFGDGLNEIAKGDVNVQVNEDYYPQTQYYEDDYGSDESDPSNTFYYVDSKVEASIPSYSNTFDYGSDSFLMDKDQGLDLIFQVTNAPKDIVTDMLYVDIYRKKGKDAYGDFIETKEVSIESGVQSTTFNYHFDKKGEYSVSVYTHDNVWINDSYFTIKFIH